MKLTFLNQSAKGQAVRMLLSHAQAPTDVMSLVPKNFIQYPSKLSLNGVGEAPLLEHEGRFLNYMRYLGSMYDYYPINNPIKAYEADMAITTIDDYGWVDFVMTNNSKEGASQADVESRVDAQKDMFKHLES